MKIALDALGGDFGAKPNIEGAVKAVKELGCQVILVGNETAIKEELLSMGEAENKKISVVHAPEMINMDADPVRECRSKKDAAILVCAELVKKGKADGFVSAGNSGATMVAALFKLGRIKGISRPAIGVMMPCEAGQYLLLDAGANTDCKPIHLVQFAVMGSAFFERVVGKQKPTVGLLSIGEEEGKGNHLVKETYPHLKNVGINFHGMIEGRDLGLGTTDIAVTDGFTGNICLKLSEGLAKAIFTLIKQNVMKNFVAKLGMLMAKKALKSIKDVTDPDKTGGAPLFGIDGVAIVSHGKSTGEGIFNAIKVACKCAKTGFVDSIKDSVSEYESVFALLELNGNER